MKFKKQLAALVVEMYHGKDSAKEAEESFESIVQNKELPKDIEELTVPNGQPLSKMVIEKGLVDSMSEWKRLVEQHGVSFNDTKIETPFYNTNDLPDGVVLKIGKRKYAKIKKK